MRARSPASPPAVAPAAARAARSAGLARGAVGTGSGCRSGGADEGVAPGTGVSACVNVARSDGTGLRTSDAVAAGAAWLLPAEAEAGDGDGDGDDDGAAPGGAKERPGASPAPDGLVQAGSHRWALTLTSAPPRANPPPRNPCGFWAPNFGSLWTTASPPAWAVTSSRLSDGRARDCSSRTSLRPAWASAARTCCSAEGSVLSFTTTPWSVIITGTLPTVAPSTTVLASPLGSPGSDDTNP